MLIKCPCGEEQQLYAHYREGDLHVSARVELWSTNWRVPIPLVLASKVDPKRVELSHYHCDRCQRRLEPTDLLMIDFD